MNKALEITGLSYSYPDGTNALSDINFELLEGESLGIIGPNGAGKSTLLLHLNGILTGPGRVKVFGVGVKPKNLSRIREMVGLVFQDPDNQLFMPTVEEDVGFGPLNMGMKKEAVEREVERALRQVDMQISAQRSSHHLSFGEKKRVSIATVLSMNPKIIALDEPSSNLDHKHRRELIKLLKGISLTKVIATHDLELVLELCPKVALVDRGRLVVCGRTLDILRNKTLLETHGLETPCSLKNS